MVDMVLRIRNKLEESCDLGLPDIVKERLEKHVETILAVLPEDLQGVLSASKNKQINSDTDK